MENKSQTFLDLLEKQNIVIPIIQRDYAQGRLDPKSTDIRKKFVTQLFIYLIGKGENELDFIYAIEEGNKMVIIDGQQRLTTLFLLHWYLADTDNHNLCKDGKSRFCYETRETSTDFCNALVLHNSTKILEQIEYKDNKVISKQIANENWFFLRWLKDPTVLGMLTMLDTIHQIKNDKNHNFKDYSNKDLYANLQKIKFQFLRLENMGSSEDMYTRMNARGEPLTDFENFKAGLIKYLEEKGIEYKNFSLKMDNTWSDYFFSLWHSIKDIRWDDIARNIIHNFTLNHHHLLNKDSSEIMQDYKHFDHGLITNFTKFMDILSILNNTIGLEKVIELDKDYSNIVCKNLKNDFEWFATTPTVINTEYKTRLRLYAFSMYILNHLEKLGQLKTILDEVDSLLENVSVDRSATIKDIKDRYKEIEFVANFSETLEIQELRSTIYSMYDFELREKLSYFKEWLRVIYNLTENGIDSDDYDYRELFKVIEKKSEKIDVLDDLITSKWYGFSDLVIKEEQLKARLIKHDGAIWRNRIIKAEEHGYFNGQIGFILHLSGISNETIEEADVAKFNENYKIAGQIFNDDGLVKDEDNKYRWERALLCFGDYRIWGSFLMNKHHDISWKRLLREFNNDNFKVQFCCVHEVFKNINNADDVYQSLDEIIEENKGKIDASDWRKVFIDKHIIFGYWGNDGKSNRFFGYNNLLISRERRSSNHVELYSHLFFITYQDIYQNDQFKLLYKKSISYDLPYAYFHLNFYPSFILKVEHDETSYKLSFIDTHDEKDKTDDDKKLLEKLNRVVDDSIKGRILNNHEEINKVVVVIENMLNNSFHDHL